MEKFIVRGEPPIPDPLRTSSQPTLSLNYSALAEHRRVLSAPGEHMPRYAVTRKSIMGAWGSKCSVTVPNNSDQEIALIDFHTFHYDIKFPLRDHHIDISTAKRRFDASGGQTCQQSIQINLINQAVTICTASQANPAYRKIAVNQAQNCRID
jgi:hypothetical protein